MAENTIKSIGTGRVLVLKAPPPRRLALVIGLHGPSGVWIRGTLPTPEVPCNDGNNCFGRGAAVNLAVRRERKVFLDAVNFKLILVAIVLSIFACLRSAI